MKYCFKFLFALAVVVTFGFYAFPIAAQQGSGSSSLSNLLEALKALDEDGGLGDSPSRPSSGLLNQAREAAAEDSADRRDERLKAGLVPTLSGDQLLLIDAFCRAQLKKEDERFVTTMPEFTPLERIYCRRASVSVFLAGYDAFGAITKEPVLSVGAAGDDYELGIGDELIVTVIGNDGFSRRVTVDREGLIILPNLDPIGAVGLTMGELRREMDVRVAQAFIGSEAYISLGSVRSISVFVAGEVDSPGLKQLTGLSSVLDAINFAGGIKKTGSLRRITIQHGSEVRWLDLYDVLFGLDTIPDIRIRHGDILRVPALGETIAVVGDIKRPGIYELPEGSTKAGADEIIRLAGGLIRPRGNVFSVRRPLDSGRDLVTDYSRLGFVVGAGDIVAVRQSEGQDVGTVDLVGEVTVPGTRSLDSASTVAGLLGGGGALSNKAYRKLAVLQTVDPATGARRFFPIDLQRVADGIEDFALRDQDRLIVLGLDDVRYLTAPEVQSVIHGDDEEARGLERTSSKGSAATQQAAATPTLNSLQGIVTRLSPDGQQSASGDASRVASATSLRTDTNGPRCGSLVDLRRLLQGSGNRFLGVSTFESQGGQRPSPCREIFEETEGLLPFVLEHSVLVQGQVRQPGLYPVSGPVPLSQMVSLAGGASRTADRSSVELYSGQDANGQGGLQTVRLPEGAEGSSRLVASGDIVRVNRVFSELAGGVVTLVGEFARPGTYEIQRGERLSDVITRAGGLTSQAYPYGAIFTRERIRRAEQLALRRLARELNAAVAVAAANRGIDASAIQAFASLTREVAEAPATGRMVMEADPTVLQVRAELDVVMEDGDRIIIPRRPASVLVTGDVLNPGALQFVPGMAPDKYIRQSGGFQESADANRIFIVFPNGVASPVSVSAFNYTPVSVPPGSSIIVPKDATPFSFLTISKELASVLSQLAITAASLAVISNQ